MSLKNLNIKEIEQLRDEAEIKFYFKSKGIEITQEDLEKLKASYACDKGSNCDLTMQQLDDVAGGAYLVKVNVTNSEKIFKALHDKFNLIMDAKNGGFLAQAKALLYDFSLKGLAEKLDKKYNESAIDAFFTGSEKDGTKGLFDRFAQEHPLEKLSEEFDRNGNQPITVVNGKFNEFDRNAIYSITASRGSNGDYVFLFNDKQKGLFYQRLSDPEQVSKLETFYDNFQPLSSSPSVAFHLEMKPNFKNFHFVLQKYSHDSESYVDGLAEQDKKFVNDINHRLLHYFTDDNSTPGFLSCHPEEAVFNFNEFKKLYPLHKVETEQSPLDDIMCFKLNVDGEEFQLPYFRTYRCVNDCFRDDFKEIVKTFITDRPSATTETTSIPDENPAGAATSDQASSAPKFVNPFTVEVPYDRVTTTTTTTLVHAASIPDVVLTNPTATATAIPDIDPPGTAAATTAILGTNPSSTASETRTNPLAVMPPATKTTTTYQWDPNEVDYL